MLKTRKDAHLSQENEGGRYLPGGRSTYLGRDRPIRCPWKCGRYHVQTPSLQLSEMPEIALHPPRFSSRQVQKHLIELLAKGSFTRLVRSPSAKLLLVKQCAARGFPMHWLTMHIPCSAVTGAQSSQCGGNLTIFATTRVSSSFFHHQAERLSHSFPSVLVRPAVRSASS